MYTRCRLLFIVEKKSRFGIRLAGNGNVIVVAWAHHHSNHVKYTTVDKLDTVWDGKGNRK